MRPDEIEKRSFEIIDAEAGIHDFDPGQWSIVRRMIHTSADFEYMASIRIHPRAIDAGIQAISRGAPVFCDTNMLRTGIRTRDLNTFGASTHCLMNDPEIARMARQSGVTRARTAVDAAADSIADGIYAIGNAPTALLRLIDLVVLGRAQPALVIGLPVGFVNAAESKAALAELDTPFITNAGRKGGSNVAASVVNALILLALQRQGAVSG